MWNQSGCVDGEKGSWEPETPVQNFAHVACVVTLYVANLNSGVRKAHFRARRLSLLFVLHAPYSTLFINKQ